MSGGGADSGSAMSAFVTLKIDDNKGVQGEHLKLTSDTGLFFVPGHLQL